MDGTDVTAWLNDFTKWNTEREELNRRENDCDYPSPSEWQNSDSYGINLLRDAVALLKDKGE